MRKIALLIATIVACASTSASAYDLAVSNGDGITIYYNFINEGAELEVTRGDAYYEGIVVIPAAVTHDNVTSAVTRIGQDAFYDCSSLQSVTIPNGVTLISSGAFADCSDLTSVTIPASVRSIGDEAFSSCSSLASMTIPVGITSIGESAFAWCSALSTVALPDGLTSLGAHAFSECLALTTVTIPGSVTSIGSWAFSGCNNLTTVVSLMQEPTALTEAFSVSVLSAATLYVPTGTAAKYRAMDGWKDFLHIVDDIPVAVEKVEAAHTPMKVYRMDGRKVAMMQRGINIVRHPTGVGRKVLMR